MMVGSRSGARIQAQSHTQGGELVEEHRSNPESSDDDDSEEEIPYTTPSKSKIDPTVRSLDHRRNRSRQLDDQSRQTGQFKRRRIGSAASSRGVANSVEGTISRRESESSSPEDTYVRAGLLSSLNAVLRKESGDSQHGVDQVTSGSNTPDTEHNHAEHIRESVDDGQEQKDQQEDIVADVSRNSETHSEQGAGSHQAAILEHDHIVQNKEDQAQADIWDIPESPEKPQPSKRPYLANSSRGLSHRGRRAKGPMTQRHLQPTQSSQPDRAKVNERPRSPSQGDYTPSLGAEVELQEETRKDAEDDDSFEYVSESSQGEEDLPDIDPPTEGSFIQDVANFKSQYPEGFEGSETYEGPAEDDDIATHINSYSLQTALQLMRHHSWGGLKMGWHQRPFDINSSETRSVRALLMLLAKLERLLEVTPKAPQLVEQNIFLNEYSNLLSYYFSEIKSTIKCIREKREKQESDGTKLDSDITSCAIPMLFHVLASAWGLGGHDRRRTAFTISTIELLRRTLGWIGMLYRPLLRRLARQSPGDPEDESTILWVQKEKRKELEEHYKNLCRVTEEGIDALEEEENRRNRELQAREEYLKRQEELIAQRKREEEARMASIKERQRRSLMSIRGIYKSLPGSSKPSSRQLSPTYEAPPKQPAQVQPVQGKPSRQGDGDWSLEEKTYLFKKIQESYPDLIDLDDVRWELNRTLEETEAMAEELLGLMLEAVHPDKAIADREAHVCEIMQTYRRTWGHEK